jgi:hypothetical protein
MNISQKFSLQLYLPMWSLWGSDIWKKNIYNFWYSSFLLCSKLSFSITQVKFHFKNGLPTLYLPLLAIVNNELNFYQKGKKNYETTFFLVRTLENTITEIYLLWYLCNFLLQDYTRNKWANSEQIWIKPIRIIYIRYIYLYLKIILNILTNILNIVKILFVKIKFGFGNKISVKANANNNRLDTRKSLKTFEQTGLIIRNIRQLNTVRLEKVASKNFFRFISVQDLSKKGILNYNLNKIKKANYSKLENGVIQKQKELVRLAEQNGFYDDKVFNIQINLVKSKLFIEYAVISIKNKKNKLMDQIEINKKVKTGDLDWKFYYIVNYLRKIMNSPEKYIPVHIQKANPYKQSKNDRFSISYVKDLTLQTLINLVLEPLVEAKDDYNNYGYRQYRDCKIAVGAVIIELHKKNSDKIENITKNKINKKNYKKGLSNNEKWIIKGNIKGFLDNDHSNWLIGNLFLAPTLKIFLKKILQNNILNLGLYTDLINGTIQGGILYHTLINFSLIGLQDIIRTSSSILNLSDKSFSKINHNSCTNIIRYANDFVIISNNKNILKVYVYPALYLFLKDRGLLLDLNNTLIFSFNKPKIQLDFLGYTFKICQRLSYKKYLFINNYINYIALYPNKIILRKFFRLIKQIFKISRNFHAYHLIYKLNPIIWKWSNYYNLNNCSYYRSYMKFYLYRLCWNWAIKKHPTLGKKFLADLYFITKNSDTLNILDIYSPNLLNFSSYKNLFIENIFSKLAFHGKTLLFSNDTNKKFFKIIYLLNPSNTSPIISASKYVLSNNLNVIHAYHINANLLKIFWLNKSLIEYSKFPSIKEFLFKKQIGICYVCNKELDFENLFFNSILLQNRKPIYNKKIFNIKYLNLLHIWCY